MTATCDRMYHQLTEDERNILKAIKEPSDIKSFSVIDEWKDDHEICLGVEINGVKTGFWWISRRFATMCDFLSEDLSDEKALREVFDFLSDVIEGGEEDIKDEIELRQKFEFYQTINPENCSQIDVEPHDYFDCEDVMTTEYNHATVFPTMINIKYNDTPIDVHLFFAIMKHIQPKTYIALRTLRRDPTNREAINQVISSLKVQGQSYINDGYVSVYE